MHSKKIFMTVLCLSLMGATSSALSQGNPAGEGALVLGEKPLDVVAPQGTSMSLMEKARQLADPNVLAGLSPLLFLKDEYRLLLKAKRGVTARSASISEIDSDGQAVLDPGRREIGLAGIVYRSPKDWTIWFNEQRVTPTAIPEEVLDIKVGKDYIDVKWFDEYTNQIFPIRLRPHERFNLDNRIYLPG